VRFFRRAFRLFSPARLWVVHHPEYALSITAVPMDPERADRLLAFLREEAIVPHYAVAAPRPVSLEAIYRVHVRDYVASLDRVDVVSQAIGVAVTDAERQRALDQQRLVAGGTIRAARIALRTRQPAVNLGGGLHHATPTQGMGFCLINDIAIAIRHLRHYGFAGRVLVVDLDLHDGNGTRAVFADDPLVHTFSIHNTDWEPRDAVASTSVALGTGVGDTQLLEALREALPPVIAAHRPEFVVYVAGTDIAEDDRLGDWRVTPAGVFARDRFVVDEVRRQTGRVPLLIVLAGGYGGRAWRYSAPLLSWLGTGAAIEPPDDLDVVVRRFRQSDRRVVDPDNWGLTEKDLFALVPGAEPSSRVLGTLSRYAIEVSLEDVGIIEEVRRRGFRNPVVDIGFGSGLGETMRLFGDAERTELLMELRLSRNKRIVPGMEVLYVEWLLLQNPREQFSAVRQRLPGQEHPGLGLLRQVVAWLIVLVERLGLDGLVSAPAQYHMAVLGRHHLRFLDPAEQARFDALHDVLRGMPLPEAEQQLAEGKVIDAATGSPVAWEPAVEVFPASDRMKRLVAETAKAPLPPARPAYRLVP
jgi:acetoin utilization deacetylase AcuC-like enzyme